MANNTSEFRIGSGNITIESLDKEGNPDTRWEFGCTGIVAQMIRERTASGPLSNIQIRIDGEVIVKSCPECLGHREHKTIIQGKEVVDWQCPSCGGTGVNYRARGTVVRWVE